jgi:nicotinate-nucleotide adenylyltransferase
MNGEPRGAATTMRVGLFGGSFNPIHLGHLRAAEEDRETLGLDLVYFIPAAAPPHKSGEDLAAAEHRLAMVQLATKGNRYFMVSEAEVRRSGPSYTVDTIRHFIRTARAKPEFCLIMGGDQFAELETWKEADEITRLSNLAVHTRPADRADEPEPRLLAALERFGYSAKEDFFVNPSGHTLTFVATTFFPVSATLIRRKIAAHQSIRYLVPGDVADYIERHALYRAGR